VLRDDGRWLVGVEPDDEVAAWGGDAFDALASLSPGWWVGFLSYDLGRVVERVDTRLPPEPNPPDMVFARYACRLVLDGRGPRVEGRGRGRDRLEVAAHLAQDCPRFLPPPGLGPWASSLSRDEFIDRVGVVKALIEAGECYQVNLTRRLRCPVPADPVRLFASLLRHNPAPCAALVRQANVSVVSASPEWFLSRRGDRVVTRPIKGTGTDPAALAASAKDAAENIMIVDMARNDLGRVCEFGSIQAPTLRVVEPHPGLHHLVSTVEGTLRPGVGNADLLRATFPPASITGAPKPRALQIIEELETCRRGVYCGAVGSIDTANDSVDLNVAIRTFTVHDGVTDLGVGGGIVADSDPVAEWKETELKSARLLQAAAETPADLLHHC
jgi:para-aminobenzoate synthetase component 1